MCAAVPASATLRINSFEYNPARFIASTKIGFTSGSWVLSITFRMNARANRGSIPLDAPQITEIVPVGATVVRVPFRTGMDSYLFMRNFDDGSNNGYAPRQFANRQDSSYAVSLMSSMTVSAILTPSSESYGISSRYNISARPITPKPIFRVARVISSIAGSG